MTLIHLQWRYKNPQGYLHYPLNFLLPFLTDMTVTSLLRHCCCLYSVLEFNMVLYKNFFFLILILMIMYDILFTIWSMYLLCDRDFEFWHTNSLLLDIYVKILIKKAENICPMFIWINYHRRRFVLNHLTLIIFIRSLCSILWSCGLFMKF